MIEIMSTPWEMRERELEDKRQAKKQQDFLSVCMENLYKLIF